MQTTKREAFVMLEQLGETEAKEICDSKAGLKIRMKY